MAAALRDGMQRQTAIYLDPSQRFCRLAYAVQSYGKQDILLLARSAVTDVAVLHVLGPPYELVSGCSLCHL